jgi:uncharacterized protein DUF4129
VNRRRLLPLALLVTALLAVVAIAAGGRPLGKDSGGTGAGLPIAFWDFLFTTAVIVGALLVVATLVALYLLQGEERVSVARGKARELRAVVILIVVAALVAFVARHIHLNALHHHQKVTTPPVLGRPSIFGMPNGSGRHVQFQWEELVIVLVLLLLLGGAAGAARSRLGAGTRRPRRPPPETLAAALDESIDDLRNDADLRRAIIAAYARMETALAAAGIPRHPAEAPLEYVERALLSLDASASAVRRLTDLFEWARFSHHEPEPSMRDDAIDALVAVRDELRVTELALA